MKKLLLLVVVLVINLAVSGGYWVYKMGHGGAFKKSHYVETHPEAYNQIKYTGSTYLSALSKDGAKADKTCFCGLHGDIAVAVNTDYSNCCYACNKAVSNFQGYGSHYLLGWSHGANATSYQPGAQGKNCLASDFNDDLVGPN